LTQIRGHLGIITPSHERKRNALSKFPVDGILAVLGDFQKRKPHFRGE
jgi:hypothetical protein